MRNLVFLLFLVPLLTFAQKIENTRAETSGEKVIITYDLIQGEPGDRYSISLFASYDNFNAPLINVTGDVGPNVSEGKGKRVEWESKLEVGKYKGPLTFEIEAIVIAPLTLKTELISAKRGKTQPLRWRGGDQNQNLKIELLKGGSVVEVLGSPSNRGSFEWVVSAKQKPGKDYSLRLVNGRETLNSQAFAIKPKIPMWVKIAIPVAALGAILVLPKSSSENATSTRLTGPPDILN